MDRTLPPEILATLVDFPTKGERMTDTQTDTKRDEDTKQELIKLARFYTAEMVYTGYAGYAKMIAVIMGEKDLEVLARAIGKPVEELKDAREHAADVIPTWAALTREQQEEFAMAEELDDLGWIVLDAIRHALNPQAEEEIKAKRERERKHGPIDDLIDSLIGRSDDMNVTVITGTIRR
jgi:hypothetical protein